MNEYNCCGVLVHARPGSAKAVAAGLEALAGVQVHASERDRLVVTIEDHPGRSCIETISQLHAIPGVLSASLVYQHSEPDQPEPESAT